MEPMLDAIRSDNPYKIAKYEDIRRIEKTSIGTGVHKTHKVSDEENLKAEVNNKLVDLSTREKKSKRIAYEEGDLRLLLKKGVEEEKSPYEVLLENGWIDDMAHWNEDSAYD
ncbi:hypothetical protein MPH47_09780 [Psychrobacillus psychrodurans]|uniref:hypothetical protein n=1 Tax=Psychrobacillus psychrodurans TaxID=126157 RepID=UPI001F4DF83D|nr:hypothetical protein [Psychrobacillus psychrodurans]MCK1997506.1 hypothetical protein [Psychrobacillus psychrodurans]